MIKHASIFFLLSLALNALTAQENKRFIGTWEGTLNVGVDLRIVFHVRETGTGALESTADSPDQSAFGIPCDETKVNGDNLAIEMKSLNAVFNGKLINDSLIDGTFTQGMEFPLRLKRVSKPSARNRPQTPQPPFPYKSEDVEYDTRQKTHRLAATITIPQGEGPFPAALLVTGSGPQNRDEEILGHKLFAVLADHLTRNGFIVLRVDDRGVGKSTGVFDNATSADFAVDVHSSIDYLLTRPEVNRKKIGLIGHSEGGMIAPIVSTQRKDISFIVLMAAPGIPILELMAQQNSAIFQSAGISKSATDTYSTLYQNVIRETLSAPDSTAAILKARQVVQQWADTVPPAILKELGLDDTTKRENTVVTVAKIMSQPWFRYFLAFDPGPYLQKLDTKVLAINGSRDIQVIPGSNLAGIKNALKKSKSKNTEVKELEGLNHLFQSCKLCTLEEYGILEQTIAPAALSTISDWLARYVK